VAKQLAQCVGVARRAGDAADVDVALTLTSWRGTTSRSVPYTLNPKP